MSAHGDHSVDRLIRIVLRIAAAVMRRGTANA